MEITYEQIKEDKDLLIEYPIIYDKSEGLDFELRIELDEYKGEPAHLKMLDLAGNQIAKILLTAITPETIDDISIIKNTKTITDNDKTKILIWAKTIDGDVLLNNWLYLYDEWQLYMAHHH